MNYNDYIIYFKENLSRLDNPSSLIDLIFELNFESEFPEIYALKDCKQDPVWHPEGDVLTHTKLVIDTAKIISKSLANNAEIEIILLFALCHDLGKPNTTIFSDGRWRSPGHEIAGLKISKDFLLKFNYDITIIDTVLALVKDHLTLIHLYKVKDKITDKAIIRLIQRVNVPLLIECVKADYYGRNNFDNQVNNFQPGKWILNRIDQIKINKKKTIFLSGKDLLMLGIKPGKIIGNILSRAEQLERESKINSYEEAISWAKSQLIDS